MLSLDATLLLVTPVDAAPVDKLKMWVHPFWEGACFQPTEARLLRAAEAYRVTRFDVRFQPQPHPPGSMELPPSAACSTSVLKLQFFTKKEGGHDFRYSTFIDLSAIRHEGKGPQPACCVGLWNANLCDYDEAPVPDTALVCIPNKPVQLPKELQAVEWSPLQHYKEMTKIGNHLQNRLHECDPSCKGNEFSNLRSYCRDYGVVALFPDLHHVFYTQGTTLPPVLACYLLQNALLCHRVPHAQLWDILRQEERGTATPEQISALVKTLRDVFAGWTLCQYEGKYLADTCGGKSVEDQPFKLAFDTRFDSLLGWDDCEGYNQCMQQVAALLESMASVERTRLLALLRGTWATLFSWTAGEPDKVLVPLADMCVAIGRMLLDNRLTVHMSVGRVHFAQFGKREAHRQAHSYGMLIYHSSALHEAVILEGTGWENRGQSQHMRDLERVLKDMPSELNVQACCLMAREQEAKMFDQTCVLNDLILFGEGKGASGLPWPNRVFGASQDEIRSGVGDQAERGKAVGISTQALLRHFAQKHEKSARMLQRYEQAKQRYSAMRELVRPPRRSEESILAYLRANWGKLSHTQIEALLTPAAEHPLLLSCLKKDAVEVQKRIAQQSIEGGGVYSHDFMRSTIFCFL